MRPVIAIRARFPHDIHFARTLARKIQQGKADP
jgi:hypothetical protein